MTVIKWYDQNSFFKFKMAGVRHVKNIVLAITLLAADCLICAKFWTKKQDPSITTGERKNFQNLKIQHGGRVTTAILKIVISLYFSEIS